MTTNRNQILILGAAGFIGTNLTLRLLKEGKEVVAFDVPEANMELHEKLGAKIARGTLRSLTEEGNRSTAVTPDKQSTQQKADAAATRQTVSNQAASAKAPQPALDFTRIDTVYHLISTTCPTNSNKDIVREMEENVIDTLRLLNVLVENGVKKIVFLSSGGTVYGKEHTGVVSEEDEACPISSYGVQKLTIEKLLYLYHEMHGLDYRIVRLSNPYGPYQKHNGVQGVVSTFLWKAMHGEEINIYGDGSVIRDYIFIDDAIEGILNIASDGAGAKLYNLGSGHGVSVNEVCDAIAEVLGVALNVTHTPARAVDVPKNVLNVERYESEFGAAGKIALRDGIKRLKEFYENN